MSKELVGALKALEQKGISREIIVDAIEAALINAYKKTTIKQVMYALI